MSNKSIQRGWGYTIPARMVPTVEQVQFSTDLYSFDEDAGFADIVVTRSPRSKNATTVSYATTGGTAQMGVNYQPVSGVLTWSANDRTPRTFRVPLINSDLLQSELTVGLELTSPANGVALGAPSTATLLINIDQPQYLNLLSIRDRLLQAYYVEYPKVLQ